MSGRLRHPSSGGSEHQANFVFEYVGWRIDFDVERTPQGCADRRVVCGGGLFVRH
jgi:hypothetical protein